LVTTSKVSAALRKGHKTLARLVQHMVMVVRRWLPSVPITVIGDGAYNVIELGLTCVKERVSLMAPLRFDARLFAPPPPPEPHQKGRPRVVEKRLPKTQWETFNVNLSGSRCLLFLVSSFTFRKKPVRSALCIPNAPPGSSDAV